VSSGHGLVRQVLAFLFYLSTGMFKQSVSIIQSLHGLFFCIAFQSSDDNRSNTGIERLNDIFKAKLATVCRERRCHEV
jgi:hypothetical protein